MYKTKFYKNLLLIILTVFLISFIGCVSKDEFDLTKIAKTNGLNGITQDEIAIIETVKYHQLNSFQISLDDYKKVYETYYMVPTNLDRIKAYDMGFPNVDESLLFSSNFIGLSIKESRKYLEDINADLTFVDQINDIRGKPNYNLYVSEIINGYSEDESMILIVHEVDIIDEHGKATDYLISKYKFRNMDGYQKIFTKSIGFGFRYQEDDTQNRGSLELQLSEFLNRSFKDGEPNYIMELDLNKLLN